MKMNATNIIIIIVVGFVVWKFVLPKLGNLGGIFGGGGSGGSGSGGTGGDVSTDTSGGGTADATSGKKHSHSGGGNGSGNTRTSSSIDQDVHNMIDSISKQAGLSSSSEGSGSTVCVNGKCQHFSGNNVSVSCVNGKCRSNAAYQLSYAYT